MYTLQIMTVGLGHGHYDFAETLGALKEIGYTGAVSVESFGFRI